MMYRHHHRHRLGLALTACAILLVLAPTAGLAERIKDIAQVGGVRSNPLVGYGLVVGLDGTGDRTSQTPFTIQTIKNMLAEMGVTVQSATNPQLKNVAAVMVQAQLPAFAKPGQQIDVTVASLGNATSLRGGSLLMAPLKGADGQIYAIAQGNLVVGGFGAQGQSGSRVTVNTLNAGRIPNGATVERALPDSLAAGGGTIRLDLNTSDFTTAARVAAAVQGTFGADSAYAQDGDTIVVKAPTDPGARTQFLAAVENLELTPGTAPAKVVINARTGTVVIGANVHVLPAAVAHGSLTVTISENPQVSQPGALSNGNIVDQPQSTINVSSEGGRLFKLAGGGTLDEIVRAVNAVGATPSDLVAILQALQQAGALRAQLEII